MKSACVFFVILALASGSKLPEYLTKCSKSDPKFSECLLSSVKRAWPTIIKGDASYHIATLNPLKVTSMHLVVGDNQLIAVLNNALFHGLENAEFKEIKWDLVKKRIDMKTFLPIFNFVGDYALTGRIIGLPLEGKGIANATFENMDNALSMEYEIIEKGGKEYIEIKKTQMAYTTSHLWGKLNNLFNGNARLGLAMNEVLNENWSAVNKELNPYLGNAFGEAYSQVIQAFFHKVPINDMLSD
ncbi:uncharacterized protein CBL_06396 [Carabus blaptoides fortunei]